LIEPNLVELSLRAWRLFHYFTIADSNCIISYSIYLDEKIYWQR